LEREPAPRWLLWDGMSDESEQSEQSDRSDGADGKQPRLQLPVAPRFARMI